jgi:3-deoxy-D-manno-octulosonic-acid transferase
MKPPWWYRLGIAAYGTGARIATLFRPKAREWVDGRRGLLEKIESDISAEKRPVVWFHAASVGEFEQGRPVMEAFRQQHPGRAIAVTCFSPSVWPVIQQYPHADYAWYLPEDKPMLVKRFLAAVHPEAAVFIKYEFWLGYLFALEAADIPAVVFSATFRPGQPFFRWYGGPFREGLKTIDRLLVQDDASVSLLEGIGIHGVQVAGDTRADRVLQIRDEAFSDEKLEEFKGRSKLLIAGSTWPDDEDMLLRALVHLPEEWKMVLVPHEVTPKHINELNASAGSSAIIYSSGESTPNARVLIVDQLGLLSRLYRYGDMAYVGGGFGKGLHNILEPAVYGLAVAFGPRHTKFREAIGLLDAEGAQAGEDAISLLEILRFWSIDHASRQKAGTNAKRYVEAMRGSTERVLHAIREVLPTGNASAPAP